MKRIILLFLAMSVLSGSFGQEQKTTDEPDQKLLTVADSNIKTRVVIGRDLVNVEENDSSVTVKVKNRGISILESLEGPKIRVEKYDEEEYPGEYVREYREQDEDDRDAYRSARNFRGHWSGIDFGFNNYVFYGSADLPDEISFMNLNTGKSFCYNLNFTQLSIGLSRHIGFVTGAGINWNNYRFAENNSIQVGEDGVVTELITDSESPVKKSKFSTLYLNVPLLLEFQIPAGYSHRLNVAAGIVGGLKLNAWTKTVFKDGEKLKSNGDYNLCLLRAGTTARIGYENFMLFGTYYFSPWFRESRGPAGFNPEPYEIGVAFTFND